MDFGTIFLESVLQTIPEDEIQMFVVHEFKTKMSLRYYKIYHLLQ